MNNQNSKVKKNSKFVVDKNFIIRLIMILVALVTVVVAIVFIAKSDSKKSEGIIYNVTIEAGEEITPAMFLFSDTKKAIFSEDVDCSKLTRTPGTHSIKIMVDGQTHTVTLTVKDTVPPTATTIPMMFKTGTSADAKAMVRDIVDVTDVKVSFESSPNMAVSGKQNVSIKLTDAGGNTKVINSSVYIVDELNLPVWEMGVTLPEISEFTSSLSDVVYHDTANFSDIKIPGEYFAALKVTVGGSGDIFYAPFKAVDTIAPVVVPKESYIYDITKPMPKPSELIAEYVEYNEVEFKYLKEYSLTVSEYPSQIEIVATDIAGNRTVVTVMVTVIDSTVDSGGPIITIKNNSTDNKSINITVGSKFNIENYVTIYDDKDGNISVNDPKVTVNKSNLNIMLPGTYNVLITATDQSGKSSTATATVIVSHMAVSDEVVYGVADKYLNSVLTEGMSSQEKINAVFNSISANKGFTGSSDKKNTVLREAYYGLVYNYGDSYTVACMMEVLLSRFNVESKIVERVGGKSLHYWNLVDFSDGWYHVDALAHQTPWIVEGNEFKTYKLTDGQLELYTNWHNGVVPGSEYYSFNSSAYPHTPILVGNEYVYNPYKVIYTVSEGGYIEGDSDQQIFHGHSSQTVMAIPASGFRFVAWSDGVTTQERRDIIRGDMIVTAIFEEQSSVITKTYILTYSAGEGGRLSGQLRQTVKSGYYGSKVIAIPNEGYKFAGWSDGVITPERTDISKGNMSVMAIFVLDNGNNYTFEYKATLGGSISGGALQIVESNQSGKPVTAVPAEGYIFNGWSDGVMEATRTDIALSDISVTAYFVHKDAVLYTVKYSAGVGGVIEGVAIQSVVEGSSSLTVVAVAQRGYVFAGWSDGVTTSKRTDVAFSDIDVTANFIRLTPIDVIYKVEGAGGVIQGTAVQQIYIGESTTEVVAVANIGYKFVGWSDGVLTPNRTDTVTSSFEVTAIFEEYVKYSFNYTAGEGGSISGKANQTVYGSMSGTLVVAVPNEGYKFVSWSDGLTTAERTDIANGDIAVEAQFAPLNKYTVSYIAGDGGSINGTLEQTGYEGSSFTSVTAVADYGYEFVGWSDGVMEATRTDIAKGDAMYTAWFMPVKLCTIYYNAIPGGSIQGETFQTLYINERGSVVTAVAEEGYIFVKWSDGVTTASRSDVVKSEFLSLTAMFEKISE